jgi:hypothetical protein
LRSFVDYCALNGVLETQYFPPPEWTNIVNQLGDSETVSTFDCADFFFQNRLRDEDSWLTAFSTCFGQFEWRVCPQGLSSSPDVAQHLFSGVLQSMPCVNSDLTKHPTARRNITGSNATVFLDDALVHDVDFDTHLGFIYTFMYAMEEQKLHPSAPKTQFMQSSCHVLSADGVAVQPERVAALRKWPVPKSATDVRAFLSFCVYLRRHIENFGEYAAPLYVLTAKAATFSWGTDEEQSFEALRNICCSPRVLATPRTGLPYQLRCEASGFAAGHIIWKLHTLPDESSLWRPIEFRCKSFNSAERTKAAHEWELPSFVGALK